MKLVILIYFYSLFWDYWFPTSMLALKSACSNSGLGVPLILLLACAFSFLWIPVELWSILITLVLVSSAVNIWKYVGPMASQ